MSLKADIKEAIIEEAISDEDSDEQYQPVLRKIEQSKRRGGLEQIERISEATVKIGGIEKAVSDKVYKRTDR